MASIKVRFLTSTDKKGRICYQITHQRKVRQISSGHQLTASEWNGKSSTHLETRRLIHSDLELFNHIIRRLETLGMEYSADDIADEFRLHFSDYTMFNFMESTISQMKRLGQLRTSETYRSALSSFRRFREGHDIILARITAETMEAYESWLRQQGLVPNTVSFYTRILRAAYNRAVDRGIISDLRPFRHVYTGIDKTVKRALPLAVIKKIKTLDLQRLSALDFARDMFMMSFYLRGMSFVDMAFLRKSDLRNGYLTYRRRKTGQLLTIGWTREMTHIVNKYPQNTTSYLLPIIRGTHANDLCAYRNVGYRINRNLKKIAGMVNAGIDLTLYVARHSWASAAKEKGIPLCVISEGMGHDSEQTTRIYLASLDTEVIDRANALIISSL
ncbi:MAG: site-specific integrase [Muribaculaceae bacterium]|nr:site-specific integrase [Muribaculaceae bacterium]